MDLIVTKRLSLREVDEADAPFILALYNEPAFKRFIGDRGLKSEADARVFVTDVLKQSYREHGFGMYLLSLKEGEAVGVAGLLKREELEHVDIGYAIAEAHWRRGYAEEAAEALIGYARGQLALPRLAAISDPDNANSIGLLLKLGFFYERHIDIAGQQSNLYLLDC